MKKQIEAVYKLLLFAYSQFDKRIKLKYTK